MSSTSSSSSSSLTFPSYLLHAPFLSISPSDQLLQRILPPSPLYYLHSPPSTPPGSAPPALSLSSSTRTDPLKGRISSVYKATSPSGTKLVLKYAKGEGLLDLLREVEEVYVNLPQGALPIPTFYGIFQGNVEKGQEKGLVSVLEDRGEPLEGNSFETLTKSERHYLFETLKTLHDIHFSHGSFSPSSIVVDSSNDTSNTRKLTLVGFSQAQWHLCEGEKKCKELIEAKEALGVTSE